MLVRFVVSNFLSFDEEVEFNMLAGSFKTHKEHVYKSSKLDILKAAAIYGSNGAGKSNLIKSLEFMQDLIIDGEISKSIEDKKFKLNSDNQQKPATFEIEFTLNSKVYVYGIALKNSIIEEEWLYETFISADAKKIFERKLDKNNKISIVLTPKYQKTKKDKLLIELMEENLLKKNELFIGKTESLKIEELSQIRDYLEKGIIIIYPHSKSQSLVPAITTSSKFKSFANELLSTFDTGVKELGVESIEIDKFFGEDDIELKNEIISELENEKSVLLHTNLGGVLIIKEKNKIVVKSVVAIHQDNKGKEITFDLKMESDGTQRLLDFIPAIDGILQKELTIIIDEIDQSLHPTLLYTLIKKVMSDNSSKGQFIFTTHESNLLDLNIFRQDEIWFVEKDKLKSCSHLYSLSEFKPRYDLDIRKGYLQGRFGAIPFMADLENLNWGQDGV